LFPERHSPIHAVFSRHAVDLRYPQKLLVPSSPFPCPVSFDSSEPVLVQRMSQRYDVAHDQAVLAHLELVHPQSHLVRLRE